MKLSKKLELIGACEEAVIWVGNKSMREAWDTCEDEQYMIWILKHLAYNSARISPKQQDLNSCTYTYGANVAYRYKTSRAVPQDTRVIGNSCTALRTVMPYPLLIKALNDVLKRCGLLYQGD